MQLHSKVSTIFRKLFELKMIKFCFGLLSRYQGHILYQITAIVIWTHMIDFDFSVVVHHICKQMSAEVKLYMKTNLASPFSFENKIKFVLTLKNMFHH